MLITVLLYDGLRTNDVRRGGQGTHWNVGATRPYEELKYNHCLVLVEIEKYFMLQVPKYILYIYNTTNKRHFTKKHMTEKANYKWMKLASVINWYLQHNWTGGPLQGPEYF